MTRGFINSPGDLTLFSGIRGVCTVLFRLDCGTPQTVIHLLYKRTIQHKDITKKYKIEK